MFLPLVAGNYYPIRLMWANAQGRAVFDFYVTAPDGAVVLNKDTAESISIVQFSCDGVTAPPSPPFGQEA